MATTKFISSCVWFDQEAGEAVDFYTSVFPGGRTGRKTYYGKAGHEIHGQAEGKLMTAEFILDGFTILALNGGPLFGRNPSISFFVVYEDESQVQEIWDKLIQGGKVLMPLDQYEWSPKYGWLQDRFGVTWQLSAGSRSDVGGQTICPSLLFTGDQAGRAEEAMNFYVSVFPGSDVMGVLRYDANALPDKEGTVAHEQFRLKGEVMMAGDSAREHGYGFNEGISLMVNCRTQDEIDHYWEKLGEGGDPAARQCGWLKDKFGVSWQVTPAVLDEMLQDPDRDKRERVTAAFMAMKKMDIAALEKAYRGE